MESRTSGVPTRALYKKPEEVRIMHTVHLFVPPPLKAVPPDRLEDIIDDRNRRNAKINSVVMLSPHGEISAHPDSVEKAVPYSPAKYAGGIIGCFAGNIVNPVHPAMIVDPNFLASSAKSWEVLYRGELFSAPRTEEDAKRDAEWVFHYMTETLPSDTDRRFNKFKNVSGTENTPT